MARVSVIVPTYNRAEFLENALRSVLGQSFTDFELIVVDDGGSDHTAALVESLNAASVRYLRHDRRRGSAAARNTGLLDARGEFVAFLDDDDEWYPEKLLRQMEALEASPPEVGAVYTGAFSVERDSRRIVAQRVPTARGDLREALRGGNCLGGASSMLMRRSCFDRIGLFDERLASFEDYDLWIRAARLCLFECVRAPLVKFSVHPQRISADRKIVAEGLDVLVAKHGDSRPFRRRCSELYLRLGVSCCAARDVAAARRAFWRACQLNPAAAAPYAYLGFSLLGSDNLRRALHARASLLPRSARREIHGLAESV